MTPNSTSGDLYGRTGNVARFIIATVIVVGVGFGGLVLAPGLGLGSFWPYAGVWAAIGWADSRISFKPVIILTVLGLIVDLLSDAPLGCWASIHLIAYFTASVFRKRAHTDRTGLIRVVGDLTALLVAFGAAQWIIGAYLGDAGANDIFGGFLVTSLLYLPARPFFLLNRDEWVDA